MIVDSQSGVGKNALIPAISISLLPVPAAIGTFNASNTLRIAKIKVSIFSTQRVSPDIKLVSDIVQVA